MNCALCQKRPDVGHLCYRHLDDFGRMLDPENTGSVFDPLRPTDPRVLPSIAFLYGELDAQYARREAGSQALGGVFGSRPPCDLHVLALRDPRSSTDACGPEDEKVPTLPVLTILGRIVARVDRTDVDGRLERRPAVTVNGACTWLYARRDWLAARDWVTDVWEALRALQGQLRGAWGDPAMRPVGTCRQLVDDDGALSESGPWRCAWPLHLPEQAPRAMDEPVQLPSLRCASCGWTYHGPDLVRLGRERELADQVAAAA